MRHCNGLRGRNNHGSGAGVVNAVTHVNNGTVHVIGVAAPERLGGPLAVTPTRNERGADFVYGNWRVIFGPKGLTSAQITFRKDALRKMAQAPEWKGELEKNYWSDFCWQRATRQ